MARILIAQCRAVALAMREIRAVNPAAQLVQNEDVGKIFATPALSYEAELQNERRWATFDLLAGRIDREHPMWSVLAGSGDEVADLESFLSDPSPPDLYGVDYYITSERLLDERVARYPDRTPGGNGRDVYVDLEAVRVCDALNGWTGALDETWRRYRTPVAVTEAHLACTREEQLRWLRDVWTAAQGARAHGADVRAVTVWSLLGAFDWNHLVTRDGDFYEPGAFDLRAPEPRPTALAGMMRALATTGEYSSAAMNGPGWWDRDDRYHYPVVQQSTSPAETGGASTGRTHEDDRPLLIVGATGAMGRDFVEACRRRGLRYEAMGRDRLDLLDRGDVARVLDDVGPWALVNAAGVGDVDECEDFPAACLRVNGWASALLARACDRLGIASLVLSSDQVFDGRRRIPYAEGDATAPLNALGRSKVQLEQLVARAAPSTLVVRTAAIFGVECGSDSLAATLRRLRAGRAVSAAVDEVASPSYAPDVVDAALDLLIDGESGVWHLVNAGAASMFDLAHRATELVGLDPALVRPVPGSTLGRLARRPAFTAMTSARGQLLPTLEDAIERFGSAWMRLPAAATPGRFDEMGRPREDGAQAMSTAASISESVGGSSSMSPAAAFSRT
jgi:dTDP-4-dehydrorhamnose reductase